MFNPLATLVTRRSNALVAVALLAVAVVAVPAEAQITPKSLIGDAVSEPDSPRYSDVANAIERYGNRDVLAARTFLETAKRKNTKLPPVAVMLAKLHRLAGNAKAVRPALNECVKEAPDDPEPYLMLAEEALRGGRTIEADALFDKAVLLMNSFETNAKRKRDFTIRAYGGRTRIAQLRRKWEQAESDLTELIKVDPENANAHYLMGQVMFVVEPPRAQEGLAEFTTARKINSKLDHPYIAAGKALEGLGKSADAMKYFEGAYGTDAKDEEGVLVAYSQALLKDDQIDKADGILKAATTKHPQSASLWLLRGVAARMKGDAKSAEQHLLRTVALAPTSATAYGQLAQTLIGSPDEEVSRRALGFASASQKLAPKSSDSNITLAWCHIKNGNRRQAQTLLQNLQLGNVDPDSTFLLAKILVESNQKEPAKKLLARALEDTRHIFVNRDAAVALQASL